MGRGLAALGAGALLLGFAAIFVKWAAGVPPLTVGFYRMAIALPALLLLAQGEARPQGRGRPGTLWAMAAGLCFTFDLWSWHNALAWTSAASATLLLGLAPLWVALVSIAFLGARLSGKGWMGMALALGGAVLLGVAAGARLGGGRGEALGLLASVFYGAYTLCLAQARRHLPARRTLTVVVATSATAFGLLALVQGDPFTGFPRQAWLALLAVGLLVQVAAWWLISWSLGHVPASLGSLGLLLQQVATLALGWLLLGEVPTPLQGAGTLLILGGLGLAMRHPPVPKEGA
ncbi:MAG TPA: DMT family transporter [Holophaga sp.]|nr:DMT family transporter [Holophaga sp.]